MSIHPSIRLWLWLLAASLVSSAGFVEPAAFVTAGALDLVLLVAFVVDAMRAPSPAVLRVVREAPDRTDLRQPLDMALVVTSSLHRPLAVRLLDTPPASFEVHTAPAAPEAGVAAPAVWAARVLGMAQEATLGHERGLIVPPMGVSRFAYRAVPLARGLHDFGSVHLRLAAPWGLAVRDATAEPSGVQRITVQPALGTRGDSLASRAIARRAVGRLLTRKRGDGANFESLRPHTSGDPYRFIDWKATARRNQLVSRRYEVERNQTVVLLVDLGRAMGMLAGDRPRLDHAVQAALLLARAALDLGDQVGLITYGTQVRAWLPPRKGAAQLARLRDALTHAGTEEFDAESSYAFAHLRRHLHRRALVAHFTEIADTAMSGEAMLHLRRLAPHHLPLAVTLRDSRLEEVEMRLPTSDAEVIAGDAAHRIRRERATLLASVREAGGLVVDAVAGNLDAGVVNRYLEVKASGRL